MVRFALIGCTAECEAYGLAIQRLPDATLSAVVDDDADRAGKAARLLGVSIVARSLDELLQTNSKSFDAVLIQDTPESAARQAEQAATAGKHIFADSLMNASVDLIERVRRTTTTAGVRLMLGQQLRFLPSIQTVKQALVAGKLGQPGLLRVHHWRANGTDVPLAGDGGGATIEHSLYRSIDLANWVFEALPSHVYAVARGDSHRALKTSDYVQAHFGFRHGGMALIDCSIALPPGDNYFTLSVIGSAGAVYADDHHNMQLHYTGGHPAALNFDFGPSHIIGQLRELTNAIVEAREPAMTGEDGRRASLVANAVTKSIESERGLRLAGDTYEFA